MYKNLQNLLQANFDKDIISALDNPERYLTEKENEKIKSGKKTIEDYRKKISDKVYNQFHKRGFERINTVSKEEKNVNSINISVEWAKGSMGAAQAKATIQVSYKGSQYDRFESEKTGGYGYDKESTATGNALNQCNALLKLLYDLKELSPDTDNRELLGYGSGYGVLPYFEGGVGFSCHRSILEKLGFVFNQAGSGKTFDVYTFTAKEETKK